MIRTILITGSARGLGAALAQGLAADGHRIALHYRNSKTEAESVRNTIRQAGGTAEVFASPLASLTDGAKLIEEITTCFGPLDTLINNAGTFGRHSFDQLTQEEWETGFSSTAGAAFYATRGALPHLRESLAGRIINIGDSMSDRLGFTEPAMSYYIGKVGLWMMTQTLAATEAPHNITVNMVSPGVLPGSICQTPETEMPQGRYNSYDDILRPIRFLIDPASQAITGTNLHAGGAYNIKPAA